MDMELFDLFRKLCEKDKDLVLESARKMLTSEDTSLPDTPVTAG